MIDALQVFVRGCETQAAGKQIIGVLRDFGFTVFDCFDGRSDNRGGLIETSICYEDHLDGDMTSLQEAFFAIAPPGTSIQFRKFKLTEEGELHGLKVRVHQHQEQ